MLTLWLYIQSIPKLILIRRLRCLLTGFRAWTRGSGKAEEPLKFVCTRCLSDYLLSLLYVSELFFLHTYAPLHASWPLAHSPKPDSWWGVQSNFLRPFFFTFQELKYLHSSWYDREQELRKSNSLEKMIRPEEDNMVGDSEVQIDFMQLDRHARSFEWCMPSSLSLCFT